MWLITNFGFFSVVDKSGDGRLTVRSRTRGDLDRLRAHYLPELGITVAHAGSDYPWRAVVERQPLAEAMASIVADIDYGNFKDEVAKTLGKERAHRYGDVWSALYGMHEDLPEAVDLGAANLPWPMKEDKYSAVAYGGVVIDPRGRFLLREVRNHFDNYVWTFAKGRPEKGESPRQTAVREVAEEMGFVPQLLAPIAGEFAGGTTINRYFLMAASIQEVDLNHQCKETERLIWADAEEAARLIGLTANVTGRQRDLHVLNAAQMSLRSFPNEGRPIALRSDFKTRPFPAKRVLIPFEKAFSLEEMSSLIRGSVPRGMDEKWFVYFENNALHLHRSWTGFCIFRVHFALTSNGWFSTHMEANRHNDQYSSNDAAEDLRLLDALLGMLFQGTRP